MESLVKLSLLLSGRVYQVLRVCRHFTSSILDIAGLTIVWVDLGPLGLLRVVMGRVY